MGFRKDGESDLQRNETRFYSQIGRTEKSVEDSKLNRTVSSIDALLGLVKTLRGRHGCPWDKKQTPRSVIVYLIEEAYELADAIETEKLEEIRDELGDVLFHIVFLAEMFQERGEFDLQDVARVIVEKMIRRHPHVFKDQTATSSEEVIQNWHKIKQNEKSAAHKHSLFDSVPTKLPALIRAYRISDRAAKSGFEWSDISGVSQNWEEVLERLKLVLNSDRKDLCLPELGDLLFSLVNVARLGGIHPETALAGSVKKFERRFKKMEEMIAESKREFEDVSVEEKAMIWEKTAKMML
ncbi:MAG: nucleoside triphosphate pyrophosphohydrolase [Deltaproteobacteria bacterium]|nr:nucleoside triphosphate pyrophosphohydrolase [Deltaproteobacteria bacterium]